MLPLAHIYVSTKVAKKKTPLLVFGSVLPDAAWTSESEIGKEKIHYAPKKFYSYLENNYPELLDMALGVRLHSNVEKGADYYSDGEDFSGFAFVEGAKIEPEVAELLGEKKNKKSKIMSHNFIEQAVDLNLLDENPETLKLYRQSIEELDFIKITKCLADYLDLDSKSVQKGIDTFLKHFGPDSYTLGKIPGDKLSFLIKVRMGKKVDSDQVTKILTKAKKLMKDRYQKYLNLAVENMKEDFSEILDT